MTKISLDAIRDRAIAILQASLGDRIVVTHIERARPAKGDKAVFRVHVARAQTPNDPESSIGIDDSGEKVDLDALLKASGPDLFVRQDLGSLRVRLTGGQVPAKPITISPDVNDFVLSMDETRRETISVHIPPGPTLTKLDVYFLADVTGSMMGALAAVQTSAQTILNAIRILASDVAFGVGSYRDFFPTGSVAFEPQQAITTNDANVLAAIGAWTARGGGDRPEAQLYALHRIAADATGEIGWRDGSSRIVVWFGDAPGHEPICPALTGLPQSITTLSVAQDLVASNIVVVAISATTGSGVSLESDPRSQAGDYVPTPGNPICGPPGGFPGQASTITGDTGGTHIDGVEPTAIVQAINDSVADVAGSIAEVRLDPRGQSGGFVASISPPEYSTLSASQGHTLPFEVTFRGNVECSSVEQVFLGRIAVIVDGEPVAEKFLRVRVPPCPPPPPPSPPPPPPPPGPPPPAVQTFFVNGSPSAVVSRVNFGSNNARNQVTVFVRGESSNLLSCSTGSDPESPVAYSWVDHGRPSGDRVVDSPFGLKSTQPHVHSSIDLIHALVRGNDGHLFERMFNGAQWIDWIDHGQPYWNSTIVASPTAVTYRRAYLVEELTEDYYINQTDDAVYKFVWGSDPLLFQHEQGWTTRGRPLNQADVGSAPAAHRTLYHPHVFLVGNDRHLYVSHATTLQATGWAWKDLGMPNAAADIGAVWFSRPGVGRFRYGGTEWFYTFVCGSDSRLWVNRWPGYRSVGQQQDGAWFDQGVPQAGVSISSAISVVVRGDRLYAFGRGNDHRLYVNFWDGPNGPWIWRDLGAPTGISLRNDPSAITLEQQDKDPLYVFVRGSDRRLHLCHMAADATNPIWTTLS